MKRLIFLFTSLLFVSSLIAAQEAKTAAPPKPASGSFDQNTYTNEFFGFSYPLTEEWTESSVARDNANAPNGTYFLFMGDRHIGRRFMNRVVITADDASHYTMSLQEYVSKFAHAQVRHGNELLRDAYSVDLSGSHFYRADYKESFAGGALHKSFVCTEHNGFLLGWTFVAESEQELNDLVNTLQHISLWRHDTHQTEKPANTVLQTPPPPLPSTKRPTRIRVSARVAEGILAQTVKPIYPDEAKKNHVQGMVVLKALLSQSGDVKDLTLISGDPLLAPAAIEAVKQWKYRPYLLNGQPIEVETQILVKFQLSGR